MLKEERVLREWAETHVDPMDILHVKAKITALRRACYEDAAKKCDDQAAFYRSLKEKGPGGMVDADIARAIAADDCAALIRGKGRGK